MNAVPTLIVLHYTAMRSCADACKVLCSPHPGVSAHYVVGEDGKVYRLVDEENRAWHAGRGNWGDIDDVNSHSIGIEIANPGDAPFAAPQMDAVEELVAGIMARHGIAPKGVIGHSDMAPGRKWDPGKRFDWRRLALSGLSVWPEITDVAGTSDWEVFRRGLADFGYGQHSDALLLEAFRLRFVPRRFAGLEGPPEQQELRPSGLPLQAGETAMAAALGHQFPVDRAVLRA